MSGMAHADPQAHEVRSCVLDDVTQSVVATMTTALLQANGAWLEIDLVMGNEQITDGKAVIIEHAAKRTATEVHVTLRFDEPDFIAGECDSADVRVEPLLIAKLPVGSSGKFVDEPKAGVVQRARVTLLGVAEARYGCQVCGHNNDL